MVNRGARTILTSSFVASILFVGLLIAPLLLASIVESGELDDFLSIAGTSSVTVWDVEETGDLGAKVVAETFPNNLDASTYAVECSSPTASAMVEGSQGLITNATTNLTFFGSSYASTIVDYRAKVIDANFFSEPTADSPVVTGGTAICRSSFFMTVTVLEFTQMEAYKFVLHEDVNETYSFQTMYVRQTDTTGAVVDSVLVHHQKFDYTTGSVLTLPVTTTDRLLVGGTFTGPLPAGDVLHIELQLWSDFSNMPADGDLLIWDGEGVRDRTGFLTGETKLIAFNIGYALIGGLLVVVATPFVMWTDIFGGFRRRGDRRAIGDIGGIGALAVIAVLIIGAFFLFGGGSFTGFFAVSLLPLSLAIFGIVLVAFTQRGATNPGMTFVLAGIAATVGFLVGISIQNNWIPYDALYVAPFISVLTGGASLSSGFVISAFFVVVVQIAGTLVALFNITQTITTDDQVSLVQ